MLCFTVTKINSYSSVLQRIRGLVCNMGGQLDELREPQFGRQLRQEPPLIKGTLDPTDSSLTSALEGGVWSTSRPGRFTPQEETRYPLYRRLDGSQGRSGRVRKISPPTGIRSPDRQVRNESLYRLSYPGPHALNKMKYVFFLSFYVSLFLFIELL